jgi:lipid-A-disaccharide synthase
VVRKRQPGLKAYIIAGERSGDQHGANLVNTILANSPNALFKGFGGFKMRDAGVRIATHYGEMAFMGFVEVLANLSTVREKLNLVDFDLERFNPDILLLIDYGGFNMKAAKIAYSKGIPVYWYIPPKAWAWNARRTRKMAKMIDHTFAIFPFEEPFFRGRKVPTTYVGNPTKYQIGLYNRLKQSFTKSGITLMPGSRRQEIAQNLPIMNELAKSMPNERFFLAVTDDFKTSYYSEFFDAPNILIPNWSTFNSLSKSKAAVVCSGTATLETALLKVPQVVCYKANRISFWIGKRLVRVKHISLVNILAGREVVKELMQKEFNAESIKAELERIQQPGVVETMLKDYEEIDNLLGDKDPGQEIYDLLKSWYPFA